MAPEMNWRYLPSSYAVDTSQSTTMGGKAVGLSGTTTGDQLIIAPEKQRFRGSYNGWQYLGGGSEYVQYGHDKPCIHRWRHRAITSDLNVGTGSGHDIILSAQGSIAVGGTITADTLTVTSREMTSS